MASLENIPEIVESEAPAREQPARFDRIARIYRAMEYLSFGPMLERCRFHFLPAVKGSRRALVLGDGDGRFVAQLMAQNANLHIDAVDASAAMLDLLNGRVARAGAKTRLTTICVDARRFKPTSLHYDLVATHFFLDCLTEPEAGELIARLRPHLTRGTQWVVSEFQIPPGGRLRAWLARTVISGLYAAFRLLTGLTVREIPPWRTLLRSNGFVLKDPRCWLGGLVVAELWELPQATPPDPAPSHRE